MRKTIIAGNWKMNQTRQSALALIDGIKQIKTEREMIVCPPFTLLEAVSKALLGTSIHLGAQNMHEKESGAFTGEIAPAMLADFGVEYVILGHSERRQYFAETDARVNAKIKTAQAHGIIPILCVGESLLTREAGQAETYVTGQVQAAFEGIADPANIMVAYEPIWAIGTGKTPSPHEAEKMCAAIRSKIQQLYGTGDQVVILYGGSMNGDNVELLLKEPDIDGGLIGGASLSAEKFARLF